MINVLAPNAAQAVVKGTLILLFVSFSVLAAAETNDTNNTNGNKVSNDKASNDDKNSNVEKIANQAPLLTVSPKRCVLKSDQDECRIDLILSWEAEQAHSVCLTEKDDDLILACWKDAVRGATRLLFVGDKTVTYILATEKSKIVAEVSFSIGRVSKKKRKSNKRRRRFWGFF